MADHRRRPSLFEVSGGLIGTGQRPYRMPARNEVTEQMTADEPGSSGEEDGLHHPEVRREVKIDRNRAK